MGVIRDQIVFFLQCLDRLDPRVRSKVEFYIITNHNVTHGLTFTYPSNCITMIQNDKIKTQLYCHIIIIIMCPKIFTFSNYLQSIISSF